MVAEVMPPDPVDAVREWLSPCPCCDGRGEHDNECTFAEDCPADHEQLSAGWVGLIEVGRAQRLAGARDAGVAIVKRCCQDCCEHCYDTAIEAQEILKDDYYRGRREGARQMRERAAQRFRNHSWIVAILSTLPDEPEPCDGTDAGLGCDCGGPHGEER